jgi:hypothetical protein
MTGFNSPRTESEGRGKMFLDTKIHLAFHAFGREIMKVGLFLMSAKLAWLEGEGLAELAGKNSRIQ